MATATARKTKGNKPYDSGPFTNIRGQAYNPPLGYTPSAYPGKQFEIPSASGAWWEDPTLGPIFQQNPSLASLYRVPSTAPPSLMGSPQAFYDWTQSPRGAGFTGPASDTIAGQQRAENDSNSALRGAAGDLERQGQNYLGTFAENQRMGIAGLQDAIQAFRGGQGYQSLSAMADPRYQAVPDEWVSAQLEAANRGIGRQQANVLSAANTMAARRGQAGGGLGARNAMAAGFRREGDLATIDANLRSQQLSANEEARRSAAEAMTRAEGAILGTQGQIADIQSRTPTDPFAGMAAQLKAAQDFGYVDFTQFDMSGPDEALGIIEKDIVPLVQQNYEDLLALARDERERVAIEQANKGILDFASMGIYLLPMLLRMFG